MGWLIWVIIGIGILGNIFGKAKGSSANSSSKQKSAVEEQRRRKAEYEAQLRKNSPNQQNAAGEYYSNADERKAAYHGASGDGHPYYKEQSPHRRHPQPRRAYVPQAEYVEPIAATAKEITAATAAAAPVAAIVQPSIIESKPAGFERIIGNKVFKQEDLVRGIVMAEILGPCKAKAGRRH